MEKKLLMTLERVTVEIGVLLNTLVKFIEKFLWYNNTNNSYKKNIGFKIKKMY